MNMTQFIKSGRVNPDMARAVIRQAGGWDSFKEMAEDVTNHGADGGFHGFIYYVDTCRFYAVNRASILAQVRTLAEELGEEPMIMVQGFRVLRDSTEEEIGLTMYGNKNQHDTQVANALAWFALEETARAFVDCLESA